MSNFYEKLNMDVIFFRELKVLFDRILKKVRRVFFLSNFGGLNILNRNSMI